MTQTKTLDFSDTKNKNTGDMTFTYTLELLDDKEWLEVSKKITLGIYFNIKEKIEKDVLSLLTFANFFGEAEEYMASQGIPFNKEIRIQYAKAIYKEFSDNLINMIKYDENENTIYISPYIYALEYGDFYRPAVGFISKTIQEWINTTVILES